MSQVRTFIADVTQLFEEDKKTAGRTAYQAVYGQVPDFRKKKADGLRFQEDRARSVGAWRLWMLAQNICLESGWDVKRLECNLSHSGRYVLCSVASAGENVGCDIEMIKEFREVLAKRFFCPSEYAYIMAQDEMLRQETFYRYWVLKESFMKATRQGMAMGLDTFEIRLDDDATAHPALVRQPEDVKERYYFREYEVPDARIAVCSTSKDFAADVEIIHIF